VKRNRGVAHREGVRTDAELIRAAATDADALAELYRRHSPAIARWFAARAPRGVAGELTAETFAQAALSLRRFRDEAGGSAAPWLFGIARNVLRRSLDRERVDSAARSRLGMPLRSYEDELDAVADRLDAARLRPALAAALDDLPASQREAVRLRVIGALDYAQVAGRLGCSELAARIRVARGLSSLSRRLKGALP
jgi:RNA polymerase sigma factor (sigma-70 family)